MRYIIIQIGIVIIIVIKGLAQDRWSVILYYSDCRGLYRISVLARYYCNIIMVLAAACLAGQKQCKSQVKLLEVYNFLYSEDFRVVDVRRVYISVLAARSTYLSWSPGTPMRFKNEPPPHFSHIFTFFYLYTKCLCVRVFVYIFVCVYE